jgi:hypothetical protein
MASLPTIRFLRSPAPAAAWPAAPAAARPPRPGRACPRWRRSTSHILQRPTRLLHCRFMRLTLGLLLVLVGCATPTSVRRTQWQQFQGGAVEVDFEQPTPQQAEQLRQRGIQLPRGSQGLADLRAHRDFVERRVTAVGFGLSAGGYLLYCARVLQGIFSRVVRVGAEPAAPRLSQKQGVKPEPAPGPSAPAPAPGPLAPSPRLVQALTGNNPTPPAAAGARLPQDAAVSPKVPGVLSPNRPISPSPSQNAQLQADLGYLQSMTVAAIMWSTTVPLRAVALPTSRASLPTIRMRRSSS